MPIFFKVNMKENNGKVKKQVLYLGRFVDRELFRTFVYKQGNVKKLANSYDEYQALLATGIWFDTIESVPKEDSKTRKSKHESTIPVS
jgi:hypothetical protein